MPTRLTHYYHLYTDGQWQALWSDHLHEIIDSGLYEALDSIKVGLVGTEANRRIAVGLLKEVGKLQVILSIDRGFEQETLDLLRMETMEAKDEFYVLYAHSKGAAYARGLNHSWRQDMTRNTVGRWAESVKLLDEGYDAIGIFWRTSPQLAKQSPVANPHFSGNFWWARSSYLQTLGPLQRNSRYDAEAWIGYNSQIRYYDLSPGYPKGARGTHNGQSVIDRTQGEGKSVVVYVTATVLGPFGQKLTPGTLVRLTDSPYVQILLKSGSVFVWS